MDVLPDTKLVPLCEMCGEPVHNNNHTRITAVVTDCHNRMRICSTKNPTEDAVERNEVMLDNV
jgi:hypothetical protein